MNSQLLKISLNLSFSDLIGVFDCRICDYTDSWDNTKVSYYYVYIMASRKQGTLYIGVTNDLARRVYEHKSGAISGFSKKYKTKILVYYEIFGNISEAIIREKRLKKWKRDWKIYLIEKNNPNWNDLYGEIIK